MDETAELLFVHDHMCSNNGDELVIEGEVVYGAVMIPNVLCLETEKPLRLARIF